MDHRKRKAFSIQNADAELFFCWDDMGSADMGHRAGTFQASIPGKLCVRNSLYSWYNMGFQENSVLGDVLTIHYRVVKGGVQGEGVP